MARRVKKLRRKIHRELPAAAPSRVADLDHRMSCREITKKVRHSQLGADAAGAALALCRACSDEGITSWSYEFGFPQILTHAVTIVEIDGALRVHDPFFNLGYRAGFLDMLQSLRNGNRLRARRPSRDRKIYLLDPACEPEETVRWLEANADCELEPATGIRRFELAWTAEAFSATSPTAAAAKRELAARGYPEDPQYLMLFPLAMFDGRRCHRDPRTMPLVGGLDLQSPAAALRVTTWQLDAERAHRAETAAALDQLRTELAAERDAWLQQKVALQADGRALEGELAKTRAQLSAATNLRAQRDSQVAQLRAEIEDTARQFERYKADTSRLQAEREEREAARLRLEIENRDLQLRLEAGSRQHQALRDRAALLEARIEAGEQQVIEMTHYLAPLPEPQQPAPPLRDDATGSRLRLLWRGLAEKCAPLFRGGPVPR